MNIHEYQAKQLLRDYGVPVLRGQAVFDVEGAVTAAQSLSGDIWVVKAQIHAGGRGKGHFLDSEKDGGGVRIARSIEEVRVSAQAMLGKTLITKQTGKQGKVVQRLYIEEGCEIARELYLSLLIDRDQGCVAAVASIAGGMNIEEVAAETPEKIVRVSFDPSGYFPYQGRKLASAFEIKSREGGKAFQKLLAALYRAFLERDASMIEINPLVETAQGDLIALDAKMAFDDNALFRQSEVVDLRDENEEDATEREAARAGLSYIKLDGSIACMVNGAGLAMATMDIVQHYGGSPANFLDVGGSANKESVEKAFKIILLEKTTKAILVNIFGGIMRCDIIAEGIVAAAKSLSLHVPLVVRLQGTNCDKGKDILDSSGLKVLAENDLAKAAQIVVAEAGRQ